MEKCKKIWTILYILVLLLTPVSSYAFSTNMSASVVVGQPTMTDFYSDQNGAISGRGLNYAYMGYVANGKLIVADYSNNRFLIFNTVPTSNNALADVVIGQFDMSSNDYNLNTTVGANTIGGAGPILSIGTKLLLSDYNNNRVLVFNSIPTTNTASADYVIGQPNLTTGSAGTTSQKMNLPWGLDYDANTGKFAVTEYGNNRVIIYNSFPTTSNAAANVVLGQADFTSNGLNRGGAVAANTMQHPYSAYIINGKLLVADDWNNRILIWNTIPTSNGVNADVVIGQPDMTSNSENQGGVVGPNTLAGPSDIVYYNGELFIADTQNNRILIFNGIPTTNNASAIKVIGQSNLTTKAPYGGGTTAANTLGNASDGMLSFSGSKLIYGDVSNNRVLIYNDDATPTPSPTGLPTSTPAPTTAPGESKNEVPNPNKHENWAAEINAGPQYVGQVKPLFNVEAPDASVIIQNDAVHDPLNIKISIVNPFDLKIRPWTNGLSTVGNIYTMNAVSAFNGYPILAADAPYTVTIPYDPALLKGRAPSRLRIAYYDITAKKWKVIKNNTVLNEDKHTISNTTTFFTYFVVVSN